MRKIAVTTAFIAWLFILPFNAQASLFIDDHFSMGITEDMIAR